MGALSRVSPLQDLELSAHKDKLARYGTEQSVCVCYKYTLAVLRSKLNFQDICITCTKVLKVLLNSAQGANFKLKKGK